ncbi:MULTISPECIES: PadR family transcriptional regulator [Paraburkholderia]|uniref:PadR family transcriptional regulator n=1 Tax=Paraburkholderia TaxID=1822464 RepID=UPI00197D63C5|nr:MULTISPECIES: PadR family transcriptional regulator [Paraburkholderia]MBN3853694.1 PadR family transcriptional regulator [Paraburkholderia sp. Ac-20340]
MHAIVHALSLTGPVKADKSLSSHIDLTILAALDKQSMHGYALIAHLREVSDGLFDFPEGTIYPVLHALEQKGFVESDWEIGESGRKRRSYSITAAGKTELAGKAARWAQFSKAIDRFLRAAKVPKKA